MSIPENECPHLDTRTIHTYGWKTKCCVDCGSEWRTPTTAKTRAEAATPYTEQETTNG